MSCQRHHSFNYRFISVMFWAFPYLLWQAFGNISGFFVGVMLALILTVMFQSFVHHSYRQSMLSRQKSFYTTARPQKEEEMYRPYQSGYQARSESYRDEQTSYQPTQLQPQYEEMQVPYPQEIPPLEQQ